MRFHRSMILALVAMTAAISVSRAEDAPLDRLTQKMKKDCEDKGGQFQLTGTDVKHSAYDESADHHPGHEADGNAAIQGAASYDPGSKTAYNATGQCVTAGFHMEMTLPPPDGPREILHLAPNGATKR